MIAAKCRVPYLYRFELMGTPEDVDRVREGLAQFWDRHDGESPSDATRTADTTRIITATP